MAGPSFLSPLEVPIEVQRTANANSALNKEDFFQLLITQLQTQDPLEPMDNDRMLDQLATLQGLETNEKMSAGIDELVSSLKGSTLNQGASLIGTIVTATTKEQMFDAEGFPLLDGNGDPIYQDAPIEGLATSVSIAGGELQVTLELPILDAEGQPVYNENGILLTKPVTVPGASITGLSDPLIAAAYSDELEEDF